MSRRLLIALMIALAAPLALPAESQAPRRRMRAPRQMPKTPKTLELLADVPYVEDGSAAQRLDVLRLKAPTDKPMPVLVFIHGGGWRAGDKRMGLRKLVPFAEKGYFCASVNYRLTGEAAFPAQIHNCKCAIRFLRAHAREYNLDPSAIGVWGSSAGGHLVALLGTSGGVDELEGDGGWSDFSSSVQAVCDWFGPSDFRRFAQATARLTRQGSAEVTLLGGAVDEKMKKAVLASPVTHVSADDPPFLIMHGTDDPVVPYRQSLLLAEALRKVQVPVELVPQKGAGHGGPQFTTPEISRQVADFFDRHLTGKNPGA